MPPRDYGAIPVGDIDSIEGFDLATPVKEHCHFYHKRKHVVHIALVALLGAVFWQTSRHFATTPLSSSELLLSTLSPEDDLDIRGVDRDDGATPSKIWGHVQGPYPTNSWYLNLVSHRAWHQPDESTRVYTVPYVVDTAPAHDLVGMRVHWPVVQASNRNVQMVYDFKNGLTFGTNHKGVNAKYLVDDREDLSLLGVSLKWSEHHPTDASDEVAPSMSTHMVRGMPYATMHYEGGALPTLHSYNAPFGPPLIDGTKKLECGVLDGAKSKSMLVEKEIQMHFRNSDFTWALFVSEPVRVTCAVSDGDINVAEFVLQVVEDDDDDTTSPLTARLALLDACTTGKSDMKGHCADKKQLADPKGYKELLRERASIYPSSPKVGFTYPNQDDSEDRSVDMTIDWQPRMTPGINQEDDLIMFALPHHLEDLESSATKHCFGTFHGSTCLVEGASWTLQEDISEPISFTANRPPLAEAIPDLADALANDIHYKISDNLMRAAADTYFSGKILARVGRVITVASELKTLAQASLKQAKAMYDDVDEEDLQAAMEAAASASLPSDQEIEEAVDMLKKGVEVWLRPEAEAPFVFDRSWGGLVNCGCTYSGKGSHGYCNNTFPHCPALDDVNEDFGNGFYNDHHFHYGYHVYAAAVAAKFDSEWGKKTFTEVLLYIRDFANPSADDEFFTQYRQKDWYLGSSWAAGIVSAENSPHGRNQESSSEAIAAYEGVALYGQVMTEIFNAIKEPKDLKTAKLVRDAGQLLTLSEVRATNRYWHVWNSDDHVSTYPAEYTQPVVGMLYETMASFQTWFSPLAVVSYGIQLMPFTPIGELRDDPVWAKELYPLYEESCLDAGDFCIDNGWSVRQAGLLATTGKREEALKQALTIPDDVFDSLGGNGDSVSNLLWYIATRKSITSKSS